MSAGTVREMDGKPIRWTDKTGLVHACEGSEVHPGVRLIWTLCGMDVPANKAWLLERSSNHEMCSICLSMANTMEEVKK